MLGWLAEEARNIRRSVAAEAREVWASVTAGEMMRAAPPERVRKFCEDCELESPHDASDELGIGWYAQIWRCRHCGRQSIRVWAFGAW